MARVWHSGAELGASFPDYFEESDRRLVVEMVDKCMEELYPAFEPEIVYGIRKEYFLPALKVLKFVDGKYYSPGYEVEWVDMCLRAECRLERSLVYVAHYYRLSRNQQGDIVSIHPDTDIAESQIQIIPHSAPHEECDCGIYGSVNLEEIQSYLELQRSYNWRSQYLGSWESVQANLPDEPKNILCIIEPSPDAKVILCRKGWKASAAFVSEIVGETISLAETSSLLSIAWKRPIDARRLYENR